MFQQSLRFTAMIGFLAVLVFAGFASGVAVGWLQGRDEGLIEGWNYGRNGSSASPPSPYAPWHK